MLPPLAAVYYVHDMFDAQVPLFPAAVRRQVAVCMHACIWGSTFVDVCMRVSIYIYVHTYVRVNMHTYQYMYACMYVCMFVRMHVDVCLLCP